MDEFFKPPRAPRFTAEVSREEWMGPPRTVAPAVVPVERVLAGTDDVTIYVSAFFVYPAGFEFVTHVVASDEWSELDPFSFDRRYRAERMGEIPAEALRIGFEFDDGSRVTNTGSEFEFDEESGPRPTSPRMSSTGGRGGGGTWEQSLWVWPLPPPGRIQFVCEWPDAELPLTRVDLDAAPVIEAASRAQRLFPEH